jgi:hypothetical protein
MDLHTHCQTDEQWMEIHAEYFVNKNVRNEMIPK